MTQLAQLFEPLEGLAVISTSVAHIDSRIHGLGDGFIWDTDLTLAHGGTWVETTLTTTHALTFNPAMIVWLGELDNMNDRQAHTWRQTILRAPTTNQQGLSGNDLPAGYVYDHEKRTETIVYFPADALKWSPHRLYELTVREVTEYRPTARYGIGLVPNTPDPAFTFAPGTHIFRFWVRQTPRERTPSQWEAQTALIAAITPLLDQQPTLIPDGLDWNDMAYHALNDLHHDDCWVTLEGKTGLRAYVKGSSAVKRDEAKSFELMTQADVLLPLLQWRAQTGEKGADFVIERLLNAVRAYQIIDPHHYLPNHYPYRQTDTFMDTWYFYENALIKLPCIAHLTDDAELKNNFLTALQGGRELAHNTHYLIPLFADANGWQGANSLLNASVSGMYAAACVLAYQITHDQSWLTEAETALHTIHKLPPHTLTHEPQQLSFAASAAAWLARHHAKPELYKLASDFVHLSLRMGYWTPDPAVPFYDARGMFQACASLCYPAYKENVEVLWAWSELLDDPAIAQDNHDQNLPRLLASFANLQRCHNYAFFDPFLPESMRRGGCPYIPYEDLATAEFTHTATLGKELYGAGEVFFSAILFGKPDFLHNVPQDILTLSLDVPCLQLTREQDKVRRWLVYNPRTTSVEIHSRTTVLNLEPQSYQIVEGA